MTNVIPRAIADVELQLAAKIDIGGTSLTLNSANDDDGNALPAGLYCFTLDSGTSNKEYLIGQLNGVNVTSVKSVSRQGVETSGAARAHRVGSPCIVTNFATLQRVADILRGALNLDGASPVSYDTTPTLSDGKQLATVQYVLDTVSGGSVSFDQQTITGTAGEAIVAGDQVYFKTSDQEWYKTDADTAATVEGVQLGIALGTGSDGVAITGGIQIAGTWTTTGLTAGSSYYASNTAGARSTSAGTTSRIVGLALSTTKLLIIPRNAQDIKDSQKDALAGGGDFGTPSSSNKFATEQLLSARLPERRVYDVAGSPHTWTKPTNLAYITVEAWGGGGSGGVQRNTGSRSFPGGGGGGYREKTFLASELGSTETVTVGAGGASVSLAVNGQSNGNNGNNTTFGSLLTAYAGACPAGSEIGGIGGNSFSIGGGAPDAGIGVNQANGTTGSWGGGGGGGAFVGSAGIAGTGGVSIYGGAGGSGGGTSSSGPAVASAYGGAGGNGSNTTASAGSVPGGGGGGAANNSGTVTSGAGGDGRCIVTEYYS